MSTKRGSKGFLAGLVVGLLIGSAGFSTAAVGYKAWSRLSNDWRVGYISGFMDMAMLARNLHPGGFVDERYPIWPKVRSNEWAATVTELYKQPDMQKYSMYSTLQAAADELRKKHGEPPTVAQRLAPDLTKKLAAAREKQEIARQEKLAAGVLPKTPVDREPRPPKPKLWCKCKEMADACPELAKQFATRKPKTDDDEAPATEPGAAPAMKPGAESAPKPSSQQAQPGAAPATPPAAPAHP